MKDDVDAVHRLAHRSQVADVSVHDRHVARRERAGEILLPAANEVVQNDNLGWLLDDQLVRDVRANKARASGDQYSLTLHSFDTLGWLEQ